MVRKIEKEREEIVRRLLVAVAKRAGTAIRKEELKRQAINARINKLFAQEIKNEIEKIISNIPNTEEILERILEKTKEGVPGLDVAISELFERFMEALPAAVTGVVTGVIDRIPDLIDETNNLIETANRILEELNKEGIYTPKLKPIMLTDEEKKDLIKLSSKLRLARERLETIIEFFEELEKYSVDSEDK